MINFAEKMNNSELFLYIKQEISSVYDNDPNAIKAVAVKIFSHLYNITLTDILMHPEKKIENFSLEKIRSVLERIKKHEPLEYIFNNAQFLDLELFTESSVLIPRPETEELAMMVSKELKNTDETFEIGLGSGCISIYLAKNHPDKNFYGCDISEKALKVCEKNIKKYNLKNLKIFLSDIFNFQTDKKFDVIISNPPYVRDCEKPQMQKNVLDYEPFTALFVPDDDALKFYKKISEFASTHLNKFGKLFFEINENFGKETAQVLENYGFKNVKIIKDCFGKNRFVKGDK